MNGKPKQILIVTKKDLLIDVVSVFLEGLYPSEIEVADSSLKVEQFLSAAPRRALDLLILEDERLLAASGRTLTEFLAPAIVVSKNPSPNAQSGRRVIYLPPPVDLASLAKAFSDIASVMGETQRDYCPVRLEVLVLLGQKVSRDIYRQVSEQNYELLFRKGDRLDLSDSLFADLMRSRYFYIRAADFTDFMRDFANEIQTLASSPERVFDLESSVVTTASVHELISSAIPELGFTPELQAATKASIDLAVKAIQRDPRLADLIASLTAMESAYRSWHSVSLCYIACRLSSLMTWDSPNTHYKLSLAAFLHDINVQTHSLERVNTLEELAEASGSAEEKVVYKEHPHAAAALARQMKDFPGDVDQIIAQHHELPNGRGFPLGINHTKISPLASLFIVAHAITEELFEKQEEFNLKEAVARLEKIYTQGYFRRVIAALKDLAYKEAAGL
ncbi:MAG: HD-GYP domain-containing protein [Bdellovibrionota bacterium]